MKSNLVKILMVLLVSMQFVSCDSKWDEHIASGELRGKTIMEVIAADAQTSSFAAILQKTGYDQLLQGDKMLTVFVPLNDALTAVDMNNVEELTKLVRNHISFSNYTVTGDKFNSDTIIMMNNKKSKVVNLKVADIDLVHESGAYNLSTKNGVVHKMKGVIQHKLNVWEYLKTMNGNLQVDFLKAQDRRIMDMVKSIQIGVHPLTGKPLYDTVWVNLNPFLKAYPIDDETKEYNYVLLPNEVVSRMETKYAQYFAKNNLLKQDSIVRAEFIKDCILLPIEISADGKYMSVDKVKMDITKANITSTYKASNGTVYKLNDADVKIYENKVKTIFIEAENFNSVYSSNGNAWMKRSRTHLSGGLDMALNFNTLDTAKYVFSNADTTINVNIIRSFYTVVSNNSATTSNSYIEFKPIINSVPYKVYWAAHDDNTSRINVSVPLTINTNQGAVNVTTSYTAKFSQKMLISFPDLPVVTRKASDGTITNNFNANYVFTSPHFTSGVNEEKQLYRSLVSEVTANLGFLMPRKNTAATSEDDFFSFYTGSDQYGDKETIISPSYGKATIFVANTTQSRGSTAGMILLDYIKLVPVVDPNE